MDVDSGLAKANKETKCPYCGNERDKPATRQYRCKVCGETIYVKRSLSNPQKRPMTYDEANAVQSETDAFHKASVEKNNLARQFATITSMNTSYMMSAISHPEARYFKIHAGNSTCAECEKLIGKILLANKHNINNMPVPNERCLNALSGEYYCGTYLSTIFDDEIAPQDRNEAIVEYSDYIDMEVKAGLAEDIPYSKYKAPKSISCSEKVDRIQLDETRRRVKASEKKDSTKTKLAEARAGSQSKRLVRSCVIISIICGIYWSIT